MIGSYKISLNCLVPWFTFGDIQKLKPHSIVFSSGTMEPLEDWTDELNIKGETFANNHVIEPHQIKLNILTHDIKGNVLDFTLGNLQSEQETTERIDPIQSRNKRRKHYLSMMETIAVIAREIPGGVLVIFPNYTMKKDIETYLAEDIIFNRISQRIEN